MNANKLIGLVCVGVALAACGDEQDELGQDELDEDDEELFDHD